MWGSGAGPQERIHVKASGLALPRQRWGPGPGQASGFHLLVTNLALDCLGEGLKRKCDLEEVAQAAWAWRVPSLLW